ncbi:MAG: SNF2 helicase associated domain-containing protein [Lachnospiraceae bacterium]
MGILTKQSIKDTCTINSTYSRGISLYEEDAVFSLLMKKVSDNSVQLLAEVEGSRGDIYHTSVKLELQEGASTMQIKEGSCGCKAFTKYSGFCKHLVATMLEADFCVDEYQVTDLLEHGSNGDSYDVIAEEYGEEETFYDTGYQEEEEYDLTKGEMLDSYLGDLLMQQLVSRGMPSQTPVTASGRTFSYSTKPVEPESSKELLDAMSGVVLQERNQFCQEIAGGDVELEVTLHLESNSEKIELRIGKRQMYVVKNIEELVDNIRKQRFVKYGKNLEFVHTQSAFTKEALEVVSLLLDAPFSSKQNMSYYYYSSSSEKRYLDLDVRMLEDLLHLFEGKSLLVESCISYSKEKTPVKRENPYLPVYIEQTADGKSAQILLPEIILLEGAHGFSIWWENCIYICTEEFCRDMKEIIKLMAVNQLRSERGQRYYYTTLKSVAPLCLCEKDYASFCATLLPILEKHTDVRIDGIDFSAYQMEEGVFELYLDLTKNQEVVCKAKAIYGEKEHNLINPASVEETYRDVRTEYELRILLEQYFPSKTADREQYLLWNDDDRLAALVERGVEELKNLAEVFVSEEFKKIRLAANVAVTTGLSIKGNLLNVSWDVEGMSKDELYEILGAYRRKRKYYRLRNGELLNLADSGISVFADMQDDLHLSKAQLKTGMAEIPLYRSLYLNALMNENKNRIKVSRDEMFDKLIRNFDELRTRDYELPEGITATLRGYQMEGYRWACSLSQMGFGGILADDMGLGKTLQMISYLCFQKGMTHLVVCPASLVYNWEAEFQKFAPDMRICAVAGNAAERETLLSEWQLYDVLITSYDLLKRDIDFYTGKHFGCEIIDEAQYIKNPATQAAKAVKAIESRNRFALTGTPIENRLSELWSIFEYLMPGYLYSYKYFKETFEEKIVQGTSEEEKALGRLHTMIAPFLLRRLKKDVLKDLPDKVEKVVYTRFDKEQDKIYKAAEKNIVMNLKKKSGKEVQENKIQILAELTKLRQICCDPALLYDNYKAGSAKLDTCMEVLESALEGGHRVLLFSQFTTMLDVLAGQLSKRNISFFMLTGSTSKAKRRELVEQFQNGKAEVFLISLKAGGTGLNLTAADMVIHYDPWWNVAAQNQATDRTHRIGQENDVTVVKLIAKDTIEERILKLQEMKQDLADKIMSAEGVSFSALSKEDLLALFEEA